MNHAVQLLSQHPALKYGARFEIRPTLDMSDLMRQVDQRRRQGAAR